MIKIDLRATDKSRYVTLTNFNGFIIHYFIYIAIHKFKIGKPTQSVSGN